MAFRLARFACEHCPSNRPCQPQLATRRRSSGDLAARGSLTTVHRGRRRPEHRQIVRGHGRYNGRLLVTISIGTRLGPYEVGAPLGSGGMGEVYRARDTKLSRDVALKVLLEAFTADSDRVARFTREAQVLAALNHPHIAQIYGLEEGPATALEETASSAREAGHYVRALVMELVEGETLADLIARGALPLDEALTIAIQVADALEAAHEKGIVHRDLKPGNVMLVSKGGPLGAPDVKVLDFGLAKLEESGPSKAGHYDLTLSPTITSPAMATGVGMLLGTAAYMSPEQAKGLAVDHRSDVFAFGCVLFEMLSGRQAFAGETVADVLASILAREPQLDALPQALDPRIVDLLRRCLAKTPRQRWQAVGDLRIELEGIATAPREVVAAPPPARRSLRAGAIAAITIVAGVTGAVVATYLRPQAHPPETRLDVTTGDTYQFGGAGSYALSPDGRALVFAASVRDGVSQLWLRSLGSAEARPLAGTERATLPFWSPDGRSVAFFSDAALKRIDLVDQGVQTLATLNYGTGGAWASDGTLLFAPTISSGLMMYQHGKTAPLPGQPGGLAQSAPEFLPDGQQFLFFVASPADARGVYVGARDGRAARKLLDSDGRASYIDGGWVLFVRRGTLLAQHFDVSRAVISGESVVVAQAVGSFSASRSGVIAYRAAGTNEFGQLQWFDRDGTARGDIPGSSIGSGSNPVVASDGRVAGDRIVDGNRDVWVFDGTRLTRLTSDGATDFVPHWMPAGDRVVFSSNRHGVLDLYDVPVNDPGAARPILESRQDKLAADVSPDGRVIAFLQLSDGGAQDIWTVRADAPRSAAPFIATQFDERGAQFSPDGRWMAYQSDESGKPEVYVRRFPAQAGAGRQLVSTGGGIWPRWSRDGRELYYVDPTGTVMSATVATSGDALHVAAPVMLFKGTFRTLDTRIHAQYDVDRKGHFLMVTETRAPSASPITMILNWTPPTR